MEEKKQKEAAEAKKAWALSIPPTRARRLLLAAFSADGAEIDRRRSAWCGFNWIQHFFKRKVNFWLETTLKMELKSLRFQHV